MEIIHSYDDQKVYEGFSHSSLLSFSYLCIVIALTGFGLVAMYSASYDEALRMGLPSSYFVVRQFLYALLGFGAFIIIQFVPMKRIEQAVPFLLVLSLVLMLLVVFTPMGSTRMGARRWLHIGMLPSFQPSELLKASVLLFLALLFSRTDGRQKSSTMWYAILLVSGSALLILLQRDYSTALVFIAVAFFFLLVVGIPFSLFVLCLVGIGIPACIFLLIEPYRIRRLVSFLFPAIDPSGMNWQVNNSLKAIASGGFWGKGLGNGQYKLGLIPEVHNDFIFASFVEETGLFGAFVLFALFACFAWIGLSRLSDQHQFTSYAAFALTSMIIWQAFVHIAVVVSLLPPTGIPLPFFSQGGTNLFVVLCECGLVYKITRLDYISKESYHADDLS